MTSQLPAVATCHIARNARFVDTAALDCMCAYDVTTWGVTQQSVRRPAALSLRLCTGLIRCQREAAAASVDVQGARAMANQIRSNRALPWLLRDDDRLVTWTERTSIACPLLGVCCAIEQPPNHPDLVHARPVCPVHGIDDGKASILQGARKPVIGPPPAEGKAIASGLQDAEGLDGPGSMTLLRNPRVQMGAVLLIEALAHEAQKVWRIRHYGVNALSGQPLHLLDAVTFQERQRVDHVSGSPGKISMSEIGAPQPQHR